MSENPERNEDGSKDKNKDRVPKESGNTRSPSALEHVNIRGGLRRPPGAPGAGSGAGGDKTDTVGVGEGATVNHLPDGGPR